MQQRVVVSADDFCYGLLGAIPFIRRQRFTRYTNRGNKRSAALHEKYRIVRVACIVSAAAAGTLAVELDTEVLAAGLTSPVFVTSPPGDTNRLFVVQQAGVVRIIELSSNTVLATPFLNIDPLVTSGGERGLLGLAFHPNYATNGFFFVHYSSAESGKVGDTVLARYQVSGNPNVANAASAQIFLEVVQDFANHNGGTIAFKPDDPNNYLYLALGDGGSGGDPSNRAQDLTSRLGKILRIDVELGAPAAAPASNPFVGQPGDDLIWAYGLRNPWRLSFDRQTGDMYIGDVGQNSIEEIDFEPANSPGGVNYGWRLLEGSDDFNCVDCNGARASTALPIHQYTHADGISVTGGYVYRGSKIPGIQGRYFFADFSGRVWSFLYDGASLTDFQENSADLNPGSFSISSFGEDGLGELYIVDYSGRVLRITGPPGPPVLTESAGGLVEVGDSVTLHVDVTGTEGTTTYQWFRVGNGTPLANGGNISGADTTSLTFDPVSASDSGSYFLRVTDESKGVYNSAPISITVVAVGSIRAVGAMALGMAVGTIIVIGMLRLRRRSPYEGRS